MTEIKLHHADNLKILEYYNTFLPFLQLCVTSTPYPGQRGFKLDVNDYLYGWLGPRLRLLHSIMLPTAVYVQVVKFKRRKIGGLSWFDRRVFSIAEVIENTGFKLVDVSIWDKLNPPPAGNHNAHDRDAYEFIFIGAKSDKYTYNKEYKPYSPKTVKKAVTGMRKPDIAGNLAGGHSELNPKGAAVDNIYRLSSSGDQGRPRVKGGSFPRGLAARAIRQFSNPGDWVIDPCCGAGTVLHEARELGRPVIGIDSNLEAVETAAAWLGLVSKV